MAFKEKKKKMMMLLCVSKSDMFSVIMNPLMTRRKTDSSLKHNAQSHQV